MVNGVLCLRVPNPQFVVVLLQKELSVETEQNEGKEKQRQKVWEGSSAEDFPCMF